MQNFRKDGWSEDGAGLEVVAESRIENQEQQPSGRRVACNSLIIRPREARSFDQGADDAASIGPIPWCTGLVDRDKRGRDTGLFAAGHDRDPGLSDVSANLPPLDGAPG